uniref:Movement protein n=1 Tax=Maize streak virus TaxID=10821 RepID=B6CZR1_9GEMI|nr:movement protein [Maize streak virus]AHM88323.1 movement protein [Maize streak virus]AHM88327.1 movement protein [Maize streak virus]AIY33516.1 movement protein [Maize streak virus]AIY33520.1 movement protein [Maize streak virus]
MDPQNSFLLQPRVPTATPSQTGGVPWSRVGEVAILSFVALICFYLLYLWVLRDLILVLKARQGRSTEELVFGEQGVERIEPIPNRSASAGPVNPGPFIPGQG